MRQLEQPKALARLRRKPQKALVARRCLADIVDAQQDVGEASRAVRVALMLGLSDQLGRMVPAELHAAFRHPVRRHADHREAGEALAHWRGGAPLQAHER